MGKDVKGIRDEGIDQPVTGSRGHCFGKCMYFYKKTNKKKTNKQTTFTWKCYSRKANSSSSVGATARCGLWPVEQYLSIFPVYHQLSPSSHSQNLKISFYCFSPSFPGSSSLSRPFQFLSEDIFGHPILLHSLQVTQPTYPLPLYPFYYIFAFTQLLQFSIRPNFPFSIFIFRTTYLENFTICVETAFYNGLLKERYKGG